MAAREKDDATSFLIRWSQRKRAAEQGPAQPSVPQGDEEDKSPAADEKPEADSERIDPADLPDIDSLRADSDFTVFMREGVPSALRQRALRRLWQVDPAFRHICMLDDYNLDYTDAATVVPNLKTIYQVGRGMVMPGEDDEEEKRQLGDHAPKPALEAPETAAGLPGDAGEAVPAAGEVAVAAGTASEPAPADPATDAAATPPRKPRLPGTARVSSAATPQRPEAGAPSDGATHSARRRRWGDPDA